MSANQSSYWNDPEVAAQLRSLQDGVTEFAVEFEERMPRASQLLEVGCSAGDDAAYFAQNGHSVIALDVSEPLIEVAAQRFADLPNLDFRVGDISHPLGVAGGSIDGVYSRLALHYFDHRTTLTIFGELAWVLRDGGQLFFACRSTEDPMYEKGREIEPDMYESRGHVRHFFSPEYAAELLETNGFTKIDVTSGKQDLYGDRSAYIKVSAVKG